MKRFVLFFLSIFLFLFIALNDFHCPFKYLFHLPCPGCGMTRAFLAIVHFNFPLAIYHNILSIPFFLFLIFFLVLELKDIVLKQHVFIPKLYHFCEHHAFLLFFCLFLSFLWNFFKL